MSIFKMRSKKNNDALLSIESILQNRLKPISPRPEFIQTLHKGLMEYTFPLQETAGYDLTKTIVFAVAGLISMIFVLSLWVRVILVILSTLGMIQSSRQKRVQGKTSV